MRITVLDEADQMCDLGFLPQVSGLLAQVRPDGQRMLFSATLDGDVGQLVRDHLDDPVVHSVDPAGAAVAGMEHHLLVVHGPDRYAVTTEIAARDGRVLLFLETKHAVDRLTRHLRASGVRAGALHSGKSQPQRTKTLAQFKEGGLTVLVATDVAARGLHVDDLDLVVNVDPPADAKDYVHRAGRTARAARPAAWSRWWRPAGAARRSACWPRPASRPPSPRSAPARRNSPASPEPRRPPASPRRRARRAPPQERQRPFRGLGTSKGAPRGSGSGSGGKSAR